MPHLVLLVSEGEQGEFNILSASPAEVFEFGGDPEKFDHQLSIISDSIDKYCSEVKSPTRVSTKNAPIKSEEYIDIPFSAGAIGLASYRFGQELLQIDAASKQSAAKSWPSCIVGIYQWALIEHRASGAQWLISDTKLPVEEWNHLVSLLDHEATLTAQTIAPEASLLGKQAWQENGNQQAYSDAFQRAQAYIRSGDCYQVNLSREFSTQLNISPTQAFSLLSAASPAPMSSLFSCKRGFVVSCSPERFISIRSGHAITQPIKGTVSRARDLTADQAAIEKLSQSNKDIAENLMIVDLMRNDFGKYCKTGTVSAPSLFDIHSYSNVHHMVSTVTGAITSNDTLSSAKLILGSMPGGSITGAPKKRAMEIIAELEQRDRSIYCGSIFYIDRSGDADSNILIRSVQFIESDMSTSASDTNKSLDEYASYEAFCSGGSGIVADSNCEDEYLESSIKISNLLNALS